MSDEGFEPPTTSLAAEPAAASYESRLVAAALACVAVSIVGAVLALGVMVGISTSSLSLAPVMLTLLLVQAPGAIAALVLSILGGMWRRGPDGLTAAVLVATALGADLMLWPFLATRANISIVGFGQCISPLGSCKSDGTTDLWIGVGVQTALLALFLISAAHWGWRLRPAAFVQRGGRLAMLGAVFVLAAVVAAIDANIDTVVSVNLNDSNGSGFSFGSTPPIDLGGGSGSSATTSASTLLVNDLGQTVRVVYCPHQNCSQQQARTVSSGSSASFKASVGTVPDSFVVLSPSRAPVCQTLDSSFGAPSGTTVQQLSSADHQSCGMDLDTLTVPR